MANKRTNAPRFYRVHATAKPGAKRLDHNRAKSRQVIASSPTGELTMTLAQLQLVVDQGGVNTTTESFTIHQADINQLTPGMLVTINGAGEIIPWTDKSQVPIFYLVGTSLQPGGTLPEATVASQVMVEHVNLPGTHLPGTPVFGDPTISNFSDVDNGAGYTGYILGGVPGDYTVWFDPRQVDTSHSVTVHQLDTDNDPIPALSNEGDITATIEDEFREITVFDNTSNTYKVLYSEKEVRGWIAAGTRFEGVVAEVGFNVDGINELDELANILDTASVVELLALVGHYYTWNGTDGYIIQGADLNNHMIGAIMNTGDWIQLMNTGGDEGDLVNPPTFVPVHISGDALSKIRADGLYAFDIWTNKSYEDGSLVTHNGVVFRADGAIVGTDIAPNQVGSNWTEVDLSGVSSGTVYLGKGDFENYATLFTQSNNWGMPQNTYPFQRKPHDGDAYLDINTSATAIFFVDPATGEVTVQHEYGHTRNFEITIDANHPDGAHRLILRNLPEDNSDLHIIVRDEANDGALYDFKILASHGHHRMFPMAVNPNNGYISSLWFGEEHINQADSGKLVAVMDAANVGATYQIIVHSEHADLSSISVGDGTEQGTISTTTASHFSCLEDYPAHTKQTMIARGGAKPADPIEGDMAIERDATTGVQNVSFFDKAINQWRALAAATPYEYVNYGRRGSYEKVETYKWSDGRLEIMATHDRLRCDDESAEGIDYHVGTYLDFPIHFKYLPVVSVTAEDVAGGLAWGGFQELNTVRARPIVMGNDRYDSTGKLNVYVVGRWK